MTIESQKPRVAVIGLGKLGAPMAAVFGAKGYEVIGVDLNENFVAAINAGLAPVEEPQLQEYLSQAKGRIRATLDFQEAITASDASFVIVPTPSSKNRMFTNRYVIEAIEKIGYALRKKTGYHVVVVTSTVMLGSTGGVIRAALEESSGRLVGRDVGLCYSPEFIALGSVVRDMLNPDMLLIGESDPRAGDMLEAIYRGSTQGAPEIHRMNFVNAELCKISVNTFVTTKISYANMIAEICDHLPGADANIVTRAIGADSRIGRKYLTPAIGYGGPCFPRDNKAFVALGRKLGVNCALAEATDSINEHQLYRVMGAVEGAVSDGGRIAIMGLSYKPQTHVVEESQGVIIAARLAQAGYLISAFDPMANQAAQSVLRGAVTITRTAEDALCGAEAAVVMTPWPEFKSIDWTIGSSTRFGRIVIDPWGIVDEKAGLRLVRLGACKVGPDRHIVKSAIP